MKTQEINLAFRFLRVTVLLLLSLRLFSQPIADFSATPATGCAPLLVQFTDASTGNPTSWKWDLGNGTISFLQNPSVSYFSTGQYTVTLIVGNAQGSNTITKNQYITVQDLPVINFSANSTNGCFPLNVQFTDQSTTSFGTIISWQWDFGDGNIDYTQHPQHTYTSSGLFSVTLTAGNSYGCTKTFTRQQYINVHEGAIADFDNNLQSSCTPPVTLNFQNLSTGAGPLTFQWNFGDGTGSTQTNPSHVFTTPGNFTVRLFVTNPRGCIDTAEKEIIIGTIDANFSAPATVCHDQFFTLINTSTPAPSSARWNFGDGTISTQLSPAKKYSNPGTYNIKLVSNFGACLDSVTKTITVLPRQNISFNANVRGACKPPLTVNFTSNVPGATAWSWNFGDGSSSTVANPSHQYTTYGLFDVTLIVTSTAGCLDTLVQPGFIKILEPDVSIANLPVEGCIPFSYTFSPLINSVEPIVSYLWNFGDGSTSTAAIPTHTYTAVGSYNVTIIAITSGGCPDTTTITNGIVVGIKPLANFIASPRDACANIAISFTDLSTGGANKWLWDFGDGGSSTDQHPIYAYEDTGYFTVTLIAKSNGCPDTLRLINYIHIKPPIAKFMIELDCGIPRTRTFIDQSLGADTWLWDFGDGTTSVLRNPVHIYPDTGSYSVSLTVTNISTGCQYTKTEDIKLITQRADFIADITTQCRNSPVVFRTLNIHQPYIATYSWDFGEGILQTTTIDTVSHLFPNSGSYDVRLIITDILGCTDTLIKPAFIRIQGPTAFFTSNIPGGCLDQTIVFLDSSTTDGINPIQQWTWDYGDSSIVTYTSPPFQHTYSSPGVYTVSLKVVSTNGCIDSLAKDNYILISKPDAIFSTNDTASCPLRNVRFNNTSTGPNLRFLWDFGDGTTSTVKNAVHQYTANGIYTIMLNITDQFGCTDSIIKTNHIVIITPGADFITSDTLSPCSPYLAQFTNRSVNYRTLLWNFGDSNTSTLPNPTHVYSFPGIYRVSLKATSPGGCIDEKGITITVKGPQGVFNYSNTVGCDSLRMQFVASARNNTSFIWDFNDGTTLSTTDSVVSHIYNYPGFYVPKLILIDSICRVPITGQDTIWVYSVTAINKFTRLLCDSGFVSFTDSSYSNDIITNYSWNFGDGASSTLQNPSHYYSVPGLYYPSFRVTTNAGCTDSLPSGTPIKVAPSPQLGINSGPGACTPATLTFSGQVLVADTSSLTWAWSFANGNASTLQFPPPQVYSTAGIYTVQVIGTNSSGCKDTVLKTIEAYPIPLVKAMQDSFVCIGNSITLRAIGAVTYNWSPSTTLSCTNCLSPVATPQLSTSYIVVGSSVYGCVANDTVVVLVKFPFNLTVSHNDSLCVGESMLLSATGASTYLWSPATGLDDPRKAQPLASPQVSTNYMVVGWDDKSCFKDTGYVSVSVFPYPVVDAKDDITINVGQTANLIPVISQDVVNVVWSPVNSIVGNNYPGIIVKPSETTQFKIEVTNNGGCISSDQVTVHVICNNANVFIPNTFSPNGDGSNELFYPRGSGLYTIKAMKIFNRWGELIFQNTYLKPNDPASGWDGSYQGKKALPDIYVYIVEIICENGSTLVYKGNIALIK